MTMTGSTQVKVTGHNKEASGRVVHYLRPEGAQAGSVEFHGGIFFTDEKGIVPDDTVYNLALTLTSVTQAAPKRAGTGG